MAISIREGMKAYYVHEAGFYELLRDEAYAPFNPSGKESCVLDIGAHVGLFTLMVANRCGPSCQIVSVEPNPHVYRWLKRNVRLNGYENCVLLNLALSDRVGEDLLFIPGQLSRGRTLILAKDDRA